VKVFINEIDDKKLIKEIQNCSSYCFTELLKVIHPFAPFISDEIYFTNIKHNKYLDQVKWPKKINLKFQNLSINNIDLALGLVTKLRNIKASLKVEPKVNLTLFANKDLISKFINKETEVLINRLAKVKINYSNLEKKKGENYYKFLYKNIPFNILYKTTNKTVKSKSKDLSLLNKELSVLEFEIKRIEVKLKNIGFVEKAPKKVVEENKKKLNSFYNSKNKLLNEINLLEKKD
jgi:valyl-tRNA synthetase